MPTASFTLVTPLAPEQTWAYLRDYTNKLDWDPVVTEVTRAEGTDDAWNVRLYRWPAVQMTCEREDMSAASPHAPRMVRFTSDNKGRSVRTVEQVTVELAEAGGGSRVSYTMQLGFAGWRRLPCVGAAVWVHTRADAARAQDKLCKRLAQLAEGQAVELV